MLNKIRERFVPWIEALAEPFVRAGISPNQLSVIGFLVGVLAAVLFSLGESRWAGIAILICGLFDVVDGTVARLSGKVTRFGGFLDSVLDRLSDSVILVGIMFGGLAKIFGYPGWFWPVLALVGSLMVSYTRARAEAAGTEKLDVGIAERAERLIILAIAGLLDLVVYGVFIIVLLTFITVAHRFIETYQRLG